MDPTQAGREVVVASPLGKDTLLFRHMKASERLGRMFRFDLELLSKDANLTLEDLIGQSMTVEVMQGKDKSRYFNGFVTRFALVGTAGRLARYKVTLRPWLWFLTRTADCRIFPDKAKSQKLTAPKIIMEVFREHGFTDFDDHLQEKYKEREHCVQYRETDFDFVSRLMEEEGIYYYFKHDNGKHTLVLCDSYSSHDTIPGYESVPYFPPGNEASHERDHLFEWAVAKSVQTGMYALRDYDFELPKKNLEVKSSISREHPHSKLEYFDYPGAYVDPADGEKDAKQNNSDLKQAYEKFAKNHIEARQARHERARGTGNVRGLAAGALFKLDDFPRADQCREYLIVAATHEVRGEAHASNAGDDDDGRTYTCSITTIDAKQPYRPRRVTAKPVVAGPQTAIVVGKDGEEIWTDKYGRVRVQFHWDRYGASDEKSSCWVRVAHPWAGKGWGAVHIPRIGQEVIVEFLDGDPDRPIITGSVYNGDNMPPYDLPANQTQSGIKSRSTKGGAEENFNEIRFEDKKGEEQIVIHAEKDQIIEVENDESHTVGHDRTKNVDNDESTTIGNNRTESVGKNESISIGESRTENVGKNESISIGESRDETVGKDETITVTQNRTEDVGKNEKLTIGQSRTHNVGKNDSLDVGKKLSISAGDEIVFQCGQATISIKKNGEITIKGKNINVDGSGKINIKASGNLTMSGSKITQN